MGKLFETLSDGGHSALATAIFQGVKSAIAKIQFDVKYNLGEKETVVNKDSDGNTTTIVETSNDLVATTTFEKTAAGKIISTVLVPTSGKYNYTKTVTITKADGATTINETYTTTAK